MTNHIIFVEFTPKGRRYTYLADDTTIAAGDHVIVPVGPDNEEKLATVVRTEEIASEAGFPFPLEKMKKVLRKLSEDFIEEAARSVPDSISGSIEEALRSKITDWTDWEKNECIAPPEEYDPYRELVLRGAEKDWPEALEALAYASYGGNNVFPTNWKKSELGTKLGKYLAWAWTTAIGRREQMLIMMISEMPLPMPNSSICSPSHMINTVPAVKVMVVNTRKFQPACNTTGAPSGLVMPSSPTAMNRPCTRVMPTVR